MKFLLACFVAAFCIYSACGQVCLNGMPPAPNPSLTLCAEYAASSCCDAALETVLIQGFNGSVSVLFGAGGCAANLRTLFCAAACSPQQALFSRIEFGVNGTFNQTVYVNQTTANGIFDACKGRCVLDPFTIGVLFPTSVAFLDALESDLDDDPTDNFTLPILKFAIGDNPDTNLTLTFAALNGTGDDITGCTVTPGATCLNPAAPVPVSRNLTFCSMYANSGCCLEAQEQELALNYNNKIVPLYGSDGCGQNIKELLCSWTCGPNQALVASLEFGASANNQTVFVSQTFANGMYTSCSDRCVFLPGGLSKTVAQIYGNAPSPSAAFLFQFNSDNDASYTPDNLAHPRLIYNVGSNPLSGATVNVTTVPASGSDLTGCASASTSSSSGSASTAAGTSGSGTNSGAATTGSATSVCVSALLVVVAAIVAIAF